MYLNNARRYASGMPLYTCVFVIWNMWREWGVKNEKLQKALTTLILKRIIITNWSVHFRRTDWCIVSFQGNIGSFRLPTWSCVAIVKHWLILYCRFRLIDMFFQYVATRHSFFVTSISKLFLYFYFFFVLLGLGFVV